MSKDPIPIEPVPTTDDILNRPTLNLKQVVNLIKPRLDEMDQKLAKIEFIAKDAVIEFLEELQKKAKKEREEVWLNRKMRFRKGLWGMIKYGGAGTLLTAFYTIFID